MNNILKKIAVATFLIALPLSSFANEPIKASELPETIKFFIADYFPDSKVSYAIYDKELFDSKYEVVLTTSEKLEFDKKGEWKEVDCKHNAVPEGIVPDFIVETVASEYEAQPIVAIERGRKYYEIELKSGLDITFDKDGKIIELDF